MTTFRGLEPTLREGLVEIDGEGFYAIPDVDRIPPFLMSVVSDGDRWMYVSSTGALTAGRQVASHALFPYETDDRLHRAAGSTGPVTVVKVSVDDRTVFWRPFHGRRPADSVRRTLLKSVVGDSVIFEERDTDLGLTFRYRWQSTERFGFVRTSTLANHTDLDVRAECVDGLLNVLPYGLDPAVYQRLSNLTNAYKRSEILDSSQRLAVYSLESEVADRPEPAEVLRATTVWSVGFDGATVSVSPDPMSQLLDGETQVPVTRSTGRPGAYLMAGTIELGPGESTDWRIVADVALDQSAVAGLKRIVESSSKSDLEANLDQSTEESSKSFVEIMATADGLQRTGDRTATAHHFANVAYNVMRGGAPMSGYAFSAEGFVRYVAMRNRPAADRNRALFATLPPMIEREDVLAMIDETADRDLVRLVHEYLPFGFSRRHGDPSRPWNAFSIKVRDADGAPVLYYEGNWRDIFQNWEATCMSFPEFLPSVIGVFVSASTIDGFNPYRITSSGVDWEVPDPDDPWSNIGYWGDHQIIYLLRLLEASDKFKPGAIAALLGDRRFAYADVPYRLADYNEMVADPKHTITFDEDAAQEIQRRVDAIGTDGKLLHDREGAVYLTTLAEKLLVPALSKLSNFVPGGGIWMNTQRPEWNDANNALVGFGLSMVTLYQLRSYLEHLNTMFAVSGLSRFELSAEVGRWLADISQALDVVSPAEATETDGARKALLDTLGGAFERYRATVYESGFSAGDDISIEAIQDLCERAIGHLDETIAANRRGDGLYHSYNLVRFSADGVGAAVEHLHEMLEGQVAILESGVLSITERAALVDALFTSAMYRPDQNSFTLYPARTLPSFLDKNIIPPALVDTNPLLSAMVEEGERSIISMDGDGHARFNADFSNQANVTAALDRLEQSDRWGDLASEHRQGILDAYEQVFGHHSYTGRSGSMYGYEGIGSIYWHMVAKLLVAIQRSIVDGVLSDGKSADVAKLIDAYWRVRAGLGFNKSASEFGAIPLDPYSHTPMHAGAQQPGMTGLVKEELLTRLLEVGVRVEDGAIIFEPILISPRELLPGAETWPVYDVDMQPQTVDLAADSFGMTFCQVPIIVRSGSGESGVKITRSDGTLHHLDHLELDRGTSAEIFLRSGAITQVEVHLPELFVT